MIRIRPHALGKIMSDAKSKKDSDLSVGAMTYCRELAKQHVYGYAPSINSKYLDKGLIVEQQSIDLYNEVYFCNIKKNTERRENKWLSGECDIFTGTKTIDIKSAWSLSTFPATKADAHDSDYEWQGRGYMMLWECNQHEVAYCMVSTPDELIGFDDPSLHYVDEIAPELRITRIVYERDAEKEQRIITKVQAAQKYITDAIEQIMAEHKAA